jgi:hypothetical protein
MNKPRYYYVNSLAGSGKTYNLKKVVNGCLDSQSFLIAQPTKLLINETYRDLLGVGIPSAMICCATEDHSSEPLKELQAFMEKARNDGESPDGGVVILTTHAMLDLIHTKSDHPDSTSKLFNLVIDEELSPLISFGQLNLTDTHRLISDHLTFAPVGGLRWIELQVKSGSRQHIDNMIINSSGDSVHNLLRGFLRCLVDDDFRVLCDASKWQALTNGDYVGAIPAFGVRLPRILRYWNKVVFMSALATKTLLFKMWEEMGVQWDDYWPISKGMGQGAGLQYTDHNVHKDKIKIVYLSDENWSKHKKNKVINGKPVFDTMLCEAMAILDNYGIGPNDRIGVVNVGDKHNRLLKGSVIANGEDLISPVSHGLNTYQGKQGIFFLCAMNPSPDELSLMEIFDIDSDDLARARYLMALYQAVLRIRVRDLTPMGDGEVCVMVVPDRRGADYLACLLEGAEIAPASTASMSLTTTRTPAKTGEVATYQTGRKAHSNKVWDSEAQRVSATRLKAKIVADQRLFGILNKDIMVSLHESILFIARVSEVIGGWEELVDFLKERASEVVPSKADQLLFSLNEFALGVQTRKRADVVANWCLIFDIDGGISPKEFCELWPHLEIVCFNSYSGVDGAGRPKFRAIIRTDTGMNPVAYNAIMAQFLDHIGKKRGFTYTKRSGTCPAGIDRSKCVQEALFYLPSQAVNPQWNLFYHQSGSSLEVDRVLGDIATKFWKEPEEIEYPVSVEIPPSESKLAQMKALVAGFNRPSLEEVVEELVALPKGEVHSSLMRLAKKSLRSGASKWEAEQALIGGLHRRYGGNDHRSDLQGIFRKL